jgi:hypothetical protein|tara:strand:- start:6 stop:134 length:129 start_codon:yes stop_codon:yes gene_type:complete
MPYQRRGKKVYVKKRGKWTLKATAKSIENAKKMMKKLRSLGH